MEKIKNKKMIAVSGGVDSIFLLNKLKHENIIVVHVNYNLRKDVIIDQELIKKICKINNLKFEMISLNEKHIGNFQQWARNKRYEFFKIIYDKYDCNELIVAHHKDDFIETAIMQWSLKKQPYYFGITKNINNYGMNISRPLIFEYWKFEIYKMSNELGLSFNDDYSNFTNKYKRNELRNELSKKPLLVKEILLKSFQKINNEKSLKNIEIIKKYYEWSKKSFNIDFLIKNEHYSSDLIFKFLITHFKEININSNIISAIEKFLLAKNGDKLFLLSKENKIGKFNNNVIINKNQL